MGHGIGRPRLLAEPVAGEDIPAGREGSAGLFSSFAAQLPVPGEQLDGRRIEGQAAALMRLGRLDDLPAAADRVVVEPAFAVCGRA
jgi:hypothetical protein